MGRGSMAVHNCCEDVHDNGTGCPQDETKRVGAIDPDLEKQANPVGFAAEKDEVPTDGEYNRMESVFASIGRIPAYYPWVCIAVSFIVTILLAVARFSAMEVENRPEKQWVPTDAKALDDKDYVDAIWKSTQQYDMWIAKCRQPGCNIFDAKYIKKLDAINQAVLGVTVDGAAVKSSDKKYKSVSSSEWDAQYKGPWSFAGNATLGKRSLCAKRGARCGQESILNVFGDSSTVINKLTDASAMTAIQAYDKDPTKNSLKTIASNGANGPVTVNGKLKSKVYAGNYVLKMDTIFIKGKDEVPLVNEWEKQALCKLGINTDTVNPLDDCTEDKDLEFTASFGRSFSDTFGAAIRSDISSIAIAYVVVIVYMIITLSRRDAVHSMVGMSFVAVIIVGASFFSCTGLGALFGLPDNNLNNNIPFLLLGLGVDDAFVLSGEFFRALKRNPQLTPEEAIIKTCAHGGVSILVTSATDALAFLIGSVTKLPALSWFCSFAGIGIVFCFLFQIFIFLPCLLINAKRANANRFDLGCCCTSSVEHKYSEPQGCCCSTCCSHQNIPADLLEGWLQKAGARLVQLPALIAVACVFLSVFVVGLVGIGESYADFQIEWFIPDNSYIATFNEWNSDYFDADAYLARYAIYIPKMDYFAEQAKMKALSTSLKTFSLRDPLTQDQDFHASFLTYAAASANVSLTAAGLVSDKNTYYSQLVAWLHGAGSRFRSDVKWHDNSCSDVKAFSSCKSSLGIKASRMRSRFDGKFLRNGGERYKAMNAARERVDGVGISGAFPYSPLWLFWEESGVIGPEFTRNVIISGCAIFAMVAVLIPQPRVSACVIVSISMSISSIIGFMHWWGVPICGVSSIYMIISIGLAVDYSAHIGHMFASSKGTSKERAQHSLTRIGPSVLNAIISTLLAVVVLAFSKSFVFVVFFRALCLTVIIGGAHGVVFLPAILSVVGGDYFPEETEIAGDAKVGVAKSDSGAGTEGVALENMNPTGEAGAAKAGDA